MSSRTLYVVITVLAIFTSYLITSIRFYSRSRSTNGFCWNLSDTIIITSLVLQAITTAIGLTAMYLPFEENPQALMKFFYAGSLLYYSTLWSIKVSISVSLIRLTERLDRVAKLAKCCFYIICATFIMVFLANLCQCIPMSTMWDGTCDIRRTTAAFWTSIGLNISTDIMLAIVPFPALLLITERRTRIAISIVFGLAGIAIIVSVVRAILLSEQQCSAYLTVMLSHIEIATGVIISALPEVSRSFTRLYLQRASSMTFGKGTSTYRQRPQGTTNGVIFSRNEEKEGFANQGMESSQDPIYDIEGESANGRHGSSSQQSILGFHNIASTDQISPYPIERSSLPNKTQGKGGILKMTTLEIKVL